MITKRDSHRLPIKHESLHYKDFKEILQEDYNILFEIWTGVFMKKIEQTITSMETAEMIGKTHSKLMRDIREYINQLDQSKVGHIDFFSESTYRDANNRLQPCYQVTRKGCEFIAHKLTGVKGTQFTAKYINRFHEMQNTLLESKSLEADSYKSKRKKLREEINLLDMQIELEEKRQKLTKLQKMQNANGITYDQKKRLNDIYRFLVYECDDEEVEGTKELVIEQIGWNEGAMNLLEKLMSSVQMTRNIHKLEEMTKR